ncbi:MAG TPA: hypothetical protein VGA70_07715 [Longimicrobiales bacterium]
MNETALVVATGMRTSVGLSSKETAASVASTLTRLTESSLCDRRFRPFVLGEIPSEGLPPLHEELVGAGLTVRERRLVRLAVGALLECIEAVPEGPAPPRIILVVPEAPTTRDLAVDHVGGWIAIQAGRPDLAGAIRVVPGGRATGLAMVGRAGRLFAERGGLLMVGGVDTYRDPWLLGHLDRDGRARTDDNLDAFTPGEGAGFVLLAAERDVPPGLTPLARVEAAVEGTEEATITSEAPFLGSGLATALADLGRSREGGEPFQQVLSSMNGERYWSKEWGVAAVRSAALLAEGHELVHPADCYGDAGAAAGPLLVGLGAQGIAAGRRPAPILVTASSDGPERVALSLTAT